MSIDVQPVTETSQPKRPRRLRRPHMPRPGRLTQPPPIPMSARPIWNRIAGPLIIIAILTAAVTFWIRTSEFITAYNGTQEWQRNLAILEARTTDESPDLDKAAECLQLWFASSKDDHALLDDVCNPGATPTTQTAGTITATTVPLPAPPSRQTSRDEWSIMVMAKTTERIDPPDGQGRPRFIESEPSYWRVALWTDPTTGSTAMRGAPRPAVPPSVDPPGMTQPWKTAQPESDRRDALLSAYLTSYLIAGEVTNYWTPSSNPITLHRDDYASVTLNQTSYEEGPTPRDQIASALATITTTAGTPIDVQFTLAIRQDASDNNLWLITDSIDVPPLEPH